MTRVCDHLWPVLRLISEKRVAVLKLKLEDGVRSEQGVVAQAVWRTTTPMVDRKVPGGCINSARQIVSLHSNAELPCLALEVTCKDSVSSLTLVASLSLAAQTSSCLDAQSLRTCFGLSMTLRCTHAHSLSFIAVAPEHDPGESCHSSRVRNWLAFYKSSASSSRHGYFRPGASTAPVFVQLTSSSSSGNVGAFSIDCTPLLLEHRQIIRTTSRGSHQ